MNRRVWRKAILIVSGATLLATPALALSRVALVIGNSAYVNEPHLTNPTKDATAVAAALKSAGFQTVTLITDVDVVSLNRALHAFQDQALGSDIAVLYYAGHGMEMNGTNYLIPVDAKLATDRDLSYEAVTQDLAEQAAGGAKLLSLVVLDACRDNPFASTITVVGGGHRGVSRGLAPVKEDELSVNSMVEYAAQSGTLASDGDPGAGHSPFASAFIDHVVEPGVEITLLFGKVRDDVWKATNQEQRPASYGSHGGDPVYIVPPSSSQRPTESGRRPPSGAVDEPRLSPELVDWQSVVVSTDPARIADYLARYPDAEYAAVAKRHLNTLAAMATPTPTDQSAKPPAFGYGTPPSDDAVAPRTIPDAMKAQDAEAQYKLGLTYLNGQGVARDLEKAKALLWEAAEQDYAPAEYGLGRLYYSARDHGHAWQLYQLAADQGFAPAQTALGQMNWGGVGMAKNDAEALRWHRKAAAAGIAASIGNVGWFYATGQVVPQDLALAAKWDQLAADRGDTVAQANLGLLYFQGKGVERDPAKARLLMTKAAARGTHVATTWLKLNPA